MTRFVKKQIRQRIPRLTNYVRIPAFMGDGAGNVKVPDKPGYVYIRFLSGQPWEAFNGGRAPEEDGYPIWVGTDQDMPLRLHVLGMHDVFQEPGEGDEFDPATLSWPRSNTLWVWGEQFLPGLAKPIQETMQIQFLPWKVVIDGAIVQIRGQTIDFASYVPASGANWLLVEYDNTGALNTIVGSSVATRALLRVSGIPSPTSGSKHFWALRVYTGQSEFAWNRTLNDLVDLRWSGSLTGSASALDYTPSDLNDWDYLADPGDVADALDQLADRAKSLENATPPDASDVTYTPGVPADWDYASDPGNVDDGLDQLAGRVTDIETAPPGGGDMLRSVYDTDDDGIVDRAEAVDDGVNSKTAAQIKTHIDSTSNPHSVTAAQAGAMAATADYSTISGNDAATDVTGAELETLTDGSNADSLHVHSGVAWDGDITDIDETSSTDIGEALDDADQFIVFNDSSSGWVRSALSRIVTWLSNKGVFMDSSGWIVAGITWTRTGDYTFTASSDVTSTYVPGLKVRWKDGGAYKYGVVLSSTFVVTSTTVTLAPNSDYTMSAATITDNALSRIESPSGWPDWFNWTPTYTGFSSDPPSTVAKWRVQGRTCFLIVDTGNGTSNATSFSIDNAPFTPVVTTGAPMGLTTDNGSIQTTAAKVAINSGSAVLTLRANMANGAWTNANAKRANFEVFYQF